MSSTNQAHSPTRRLRDGLVVAIVVATIVAITVWRMTAPAESAPPPPTTATSTTTTPPVIESPIPDGGTFVFIKEVKDGGIVVDVADLLSGEEARLAAIEDGIIGADEDLPNDVYIRNKLVEPVEMSTAPDAKLTVLVFDNSGSIVERDIKLNELKMAFTGTYAGHVIYGLVAGEFPVTVNVDSGVVVSFKQVYLP